MSCGTYQIKNAVNDRIYVGQSIQIEERFAQHRRLLKASKGRLRTRQKISLAHLGKPKRSPANEFRQRRSSKAIEDKIVKRLTFDK